MAENREIWLRNAIIKNRPGNLSIFFAIFFGETGEIVMNREHVP